MKKKLFILSLILNSVQISNCQITFEKFFSKNFISIGHSVQQTNDGGYIICGSTYIYDTQYDWNVLLIKTDVYGNKVWLKEIGGNGIEEGNSVCQTNDGGYIITGCKENESTLIREIYLVKTNSMGNTTWTKTFGGEYSQEGESVCQTSDDGYVICGTSSESPVSQILITKTDSVGDILWTKKFFNNIRCKGYSIKQTIDNGYIITGNYYPENGFSPRIYLIKTNEYGDTLWTNVFGGEHSCEGRCVQQTFDYGYIIAGSIQIPGFYYNGYLVKTNEYGDTIWTKSHGTFRNESYCSVCQTSDNGYIMAGSISTLEGDYNVFLLKSDNNGDSLWSKQYNAQASYLNEGGYSVQQTDDNGFIIVGYAFCDLFVDATEVYLIKTNEDGVVTRISNNISKDNEVYLFPNPTNNYLTLKVSSNNTFEIEIRNINGKLVFQKFNINQIEKIDLSSFPKGLYYLRIINPENSIIKKIIKF
ncbi:MAG: T9SS type A sorting domain-containing protein [Bacteroidales bacterium]|nr:T9SS type A sorting domain-containing protein [Bacteroidales bacterium]